mmetsp:Transcript_24652/g.29850  ORF Transcript_24652/g.29850 Transcript_24652/m.29850 type:complete len:343 (-) Transcript_24652:96-1124(-)|eukprot:CAMPEP_0197855562 /NCGR_PEP_ID=MMETSP1438-20131217/26866_1 /TAXON_ID=1461541 /ORGANISM="Pterosperma sp., Strain CCMP1384" /LENGTH=342 /DNA_ID=CAMNT_0043470725 /DNA_START=222 /DNA_END=1250 /DNA_ORIENTATION=-
MGERKVLNKYIPPDYDPLSVPRMRKPKDEQMKVRMMLPMTICCETCGNFICKGTKFNTRKEDVQGPEGKYLGIQIFRFYFKCTRCGAELAMKTDPKNSDYVMEMGATRNFEPWRDPEAQTDIAKAQREADELGDSMKALENRTLDSKREMDILAALDEMKSLNSRHAHVTSEQMIAAIHGSGEETSTEAPSTLTADDEALVKKLFNAQKTVKRLDDDDDDDAPKRKKSKKAGTSGPSGSSASASASASASVSASNGGQAAAPEPSSKPTPTPETKVEKAPAPVSAPSFAVRAKPVKFAVKVKKEQAPPKVEEPEKQEEGSDDDSGGGGGLMGLMGAYGSDSD